MRTGETLAKIKSLRADLDRLEREFGGVRDKLEDLLGEAEEEISTVENAKESIDQLIDLISEGH